MLINYADRSQHADYYTTDDCLHKGKTDVKSVFHLSVVEESSTSVLVAGNTV